MLKRVESGIIAGPQLNLAVFTFGHLSPQAVEPWFVFHRSNVHIGMVEDVAKKVQGSVLTLILNQERG